MYKSLHLAHIADCLSYAKGKLFMAGDCKETCGEDNCVLFIFMCGVTQEGPARSDRTHILVQEC